MRKIFLDLGGYTGDTVKLFQEKYPDSNQFEIFCFEPNPHLAAFHHNKSYNFCPFAIWVEDCVLTFHIWSNGLGSTLLNEKFSKNSKRKESVDVQAINFSKWVKDNFSKEDFIVLKMDIEGAEYKVLQHMINEDTISYIDELYVDWHAKKISNFDKNIHSNLVDYLNKIGLKPGDMCGETGEIKK